MFIPARIADASKVKIFKVERPFSNFQWVTAQFGGLETLQRILSQIRVQKAQTMILETLRAGGASDLQEENEDLHTRLSGHFRSTAYRLSFFRTSISDLDVLKAVSPTDVLGYAIIKSDEHQHGQNRVYESVIRSSAQPNNYVRGGQVWEFAVNGHRFSVAGYLYAQQNGITNCCGHVALRTAVARFHPAGDLSYREMNNLLGIDHVQRQLGPGGNCPGITTEQMVQVLETAGASCVIADYQKRRRIALPPYQKYVYSSIESGFPAIILFGTPGNVGHAIPVFGHTFNQDVWVPNAEQFYFDAKGGTGYTPSDSWLSSFICHDDNLGSNLCIPRHYLRIPVTKNAPSRPNLGADHVAGVITTLPSQVKLSPIRAEAIAFDFLEPILATLPTKDNVWVEHLRQALTAGRVILRTIMCTAVQYADHLARVKDWDLNEVDKANITNIKKSGNRILWLVEISVPELFPANRRKVGEMLLTAGSFSSAARDFRNFELARLPGFYTSFDSNTPDGKVKFRYIPCALTSHVELFGSEEPQ